jgi:Uma2 family endonuclease
MSRNATDTTRKNTAHRNGGIPTWEIAQLFPPQGAWSESEYLNLENYYGAHIRVELFQGRLEVLPVPTLTHQLIIAFFFDLLRDFSRVHAPGLVLFSGIRVKVPKKKKDDPEFREPDVVYMKDENLDRCLEEYWIGADLVMEVVSGDAKDRHRDLVVKPRQYAAARIPEYWIIEPDAKFIRVLTLRGKNYKVHEFRPGKIATSMFLPGFSMAVDVVLAAGKAKRN